MKCWVITAFYILVTISVNAQDLDDLLKKEADKEAMYAEATFKGTRIINGHSVETRKKGVLEFVISHRFGRINASTYELFGLDQSNIRFGLEYALSDRLTVALGRSSFEKAFDGYGKYRLIRQRTSSTGWVPISITLFGSAVKKTLRDYDPANKPPITDQLFYTAQVIIARKFNTRLSMQVVPSMVHRNVVDDALDPHDIFSLGYSARLKVSNRIALSGEYYYQLNPLKSQNYHNAIGVGVDIETGGHVFQLHLTNSIAMIEKGFITETEGNLFKGDIHFGFNVTRAFQITNKKH